MTFNLRQATLVVDTDFEVQLARTINMPAIELQNLLSGVRPATTSLLVVSQQKAIAKGSEIVAGGVSRDLVRIVDLEGYYSLADMIQTPNLHEHLRVVFQRSLCVLGDKFRYMDQWSDDMPWDPWKTDDQVFQDWIRWRPRNLAVVVGDHGSGKSTFSQLLMFKLLTGPTLQSQGARASIYAIEDDRRVFGRLIDAFDSSGRLALRSRIGWFEPDADPERALDDYLDRIEFLTRSEGIKLHILDPWNAMNHDPGSDTETRYVQKMLVRLQQLTKQYEMSIIVVTHLPKRERRSRRDRFFMPFGIGDASGSKQWADKADMGFCVTASDIPFRCQHMSEDDLNVLGISPEVRNQAMEHGIHGEEHMIVMTDKVKSRGFDEFGMGAYKAVRAFVYDRKEASLQYDQGASIIAKSMWG